MRGLLFLEPRDYWRPEVLQLVTDKQKRDCVTLKYRTWLLQDFHTLYCVKAVHGFCLWYRQDFVSFKKSVVALIINHKYLAKSQYTLSFSL